jgi:asparagine synthase (glutamine-hydrolysing)
MCGICGAFDFKGHPIDGSLIQRMSAAIRHRGPDGSGSYVCGEIGLGHRRLSIIDLEGGAQPISNEDRTLQVVFNGEIYNFIELREELMGFGHRFETRSDTEVIVHAYEQWGPECVARFNGIFSFALWDTTKRQLLLARDHLGVKPLYYVVAGGRLLFASEIKSLLQDQECPRDVDVEALGALFTLRYVPSPDTLFKGIKKLPPAHILLVGSQGLELKRYWKATPKQQQNPDENELIERYQSLVEDAVRLQMRSDVPVGLFLSSGVDSSALLALMSRIAVKPVRTFTIGFEDGEQSNETVDARAVAGRFGAEHHEMIVRAKDYEDYYERYLWDIEEPVGNETAAAFYFVSMIASGNVKVALTGQGADEPWAGYHRYIGVKLSEFYSRLPGFFTEQLVKPLIDRFAKNERARRAAFSLNEPDVLTRFVKIYSFYDSEMKARLFQEWVKESTCTDGKQARQALSRLHSDVSDLDPLTQMLYIDTRASLPDDLLMVGDKTSMANSIEARVPFLDYRLIEFVESLPPHFRLRGLRGKYLHKKAAEKWLPKHIVYRKKKGFANPIDQWLRGRMRRYVGDCLLSDSATVNRYFNPGFIRQMVADHEAGRQNYLRHLYLLISFELWHNKFIRSFSPVPLTTQIGNVPETQMTRS